MSLHPGWERIPSSIRLGVAASAVTADVQKPAFAVIQAIQSLSPDKQLIATFAAAAIMANAIGKDPYELLTQVRKMLMEAGLHDGHIEAIADYARGELA